MVISGFLLILFFPFMFPVQIQCICQCKWFAEHQSLEVKWFAETYILQNICKTILIV